MPTAVPGRVVSEMDQPEAWKLGSIFVPRKEHHPSTRQASEKTNTYRHSRGLAHDDTTTLDTNKAPVPVPPPTVASYARTLGSVRPPDQVTGSLRPSRSRSPRRCSFERCCPMRVRPAALPSPLLVPTAGGEGPPPSPGASQPRGPRTTTRRRDRQPGPPPSPSRPMSSPTPCRGPPRATCTSTLSGPSRRR